MKNVSEQFKNAIKQPSREIKSRITFPGLVLDSSHIRSIELDSLLIGTNDFEIGTAPMDMVKIEIIEPADLGDGNNLVLKSGIKSGFDKSIATTDGGNFEREGSFTLRKYAKFRWRDLM